jgi:hypothetical protein
MKSLILLLLLFPMAAQAELSLMVGLGKNAITDNIHGTHESFERMGSLGYSLDLSENFYVKPEIGGWLGGPGKESWFVGIPVGVKLWVPNSGAFAFASVGPSYISAPDDLLGSHWQFDTEFGFGLKDTLTTLALFYKHFSSAGFFMPNIGRDFFGIQLRICI